MNWMFWTWPAWQMAIVFIALVVLGVIALDLYRRYSERADAAFEKRVFDLLNRRSHTLRDLTGVRHDIDRHDDAVRRLEALAAHLGLEWVYPKDGRYRIEVRTTPATPAKDTSK